MVEINYFFTLVLLKLSECTIVYLAVLRHPWNPGDEWIRSFQNLYLQ